MARVVNSRIRFLLLLIVVAFGALLARAAWIQTVRAASLSRLATAQTRVPVQLPAGRGTIFDAMGSPLALGEQATTIFADPRQIARPRADATVAARVLGLKPGPLDPAARRPHARLRLRRAEGASGRRDRARAEEPRRLRLLSGGAPRLSPALGCRSGARLRGRRQQRSRGPRAPAQHAADRQDRARRPSCAIRSVTSSRSRTRGPRARAGTCSSRSTTRSRRTRSRCCARRSRSGGRRTRRRSCSTRTRAACSRWRWSRGTTRTRSRPPRRRACRAITPSRTRSSPGRCSRS